MNASFRINRSSNGFVTTFQIDIDNFVISQFPFTMSNGNGAVKTHYYMSYFTFLLFLSTGFTTLAQIISLYGPGEGDCRYGFVVAPVVLQATAVAICLFALWYTFREWIRRFWGNLGNDKRFLGILREIPSALATIAAIIQLLGTIASLVMLSLISSAKDGCNNDAYNIVNSIVGSGVSFVAALIASFIEIKFSPYRIEKIDYHHFHVIPTSPDHCISFIKKDQFKIFDLSAEQCEERRTVPPITIPVPWILPKLHRTQPKLHIIHLMNRPYCY